METKIGTTEISESVGTAADVADSVPGSRSYPSVTRTPRTPREFAPGGYSKVYVKLGVTRSLGEFEFARVDVAIEDFCEPTRDQRSRAFDEATEEVKVHLTKVLRKIEAARTQIPGGEHGEG